MNDITDLDALELSSAIHAGIVSCREVMAAYLERIDRLNPRLNAIVSRAPHEDLLRQADERDAELARGRSRSGSRGWMHGLPQAIKDIAHAAGFPTTQGNRLLKDAVAAQDSLYVARMKAAGAIVIGKTNVPELGFGSHTYNALFGSTGNAWDGGVSAGGSSGGAAVALAHRLLPVADGSDVMGSLRNPAGWNHVFGLRPSQGRVPSWPAADVWLSQLGTSGPLGRSVRDLAALLASQAGYDARVPMSLADPAGTSFMPPPDAGQNGLKGVRIGWLGDLAGHLPFEPGILPLCEASLARCTRAGAAVEPCALGYSPDAVWDAWLTWRASDSAPKVAVLLQQPGAREFIKPEALWEHDRAQGLSLKDMTNAAAVRTGFLNALLAHFERFDVLALPSAQVWPFDVSLAWPKAIGGRSMDTYHRWMEVTLYATFAGLPAISVPAGFDATGRWPMGLQLIGRPRGDAALLAVAAGYESASAELLARRPA